MKKLFLLLLILLMNNACTRSKKNVEQDFTLEYHLQKLKKAGQVLYLKFCLECHSPKNATDNFLVGNIRNDYYDQDFLIGYINHQDSLLQHKNELVVNLKEEYNNIGYLHQFNLTKQEIKAILYYLKN